MLFARLHGIARRIRRGGPEHVPAPAVRGRPLSIPLAIPRAIPLDTTPRWGGPGVHGIPRARTWDAVAVVDDPGPDGADRARFVVLPGGVVLAEEGPAAGLETLVAAASAGLGPPYRAEAVRRDSAHWAVAATSIEVATLPAGTPGNDIVLSVQAGGRQLRVDDLPDFTSLPAVEALGAGCGEAFVVQASRLVGDVWEIRAEPL